MQIILMFSHKLGLDCKGIHISDQRKNINTKELVMGFRQFWKTRKCESPVQRVGTQKCSSDLLLWQCNLFRGRQEKSKFHHGLTRKIASSTQRAAPWKVRSMGSGFKSCLSLLSPKWPLNMTSPCWTSVSLPGKWVSQDTICKELRSVPVTQKSFNSD